MAAQYGQKYGNGENAQGATADSAMARLGRKFGRVAFARALLKGLEHSYVANGGLALRVLVFHGVRSGIRLAISAATVLMDGNSAPGSQRVRR